MALQIIIDDKNQRFVEASRLLEEMASLETFNGTTEGRLADNWYNLKAQVYEATVTPVKPAVKKGGG